MVLQIEDAREAGAVPQRIVPAAVRALGGEEVLDATLDRRLARHARGEEAQERPRGLARSRDAGARELRPDVRIARLAPATVRALGALQPAHRPLHLAVPAGGA